MRSGRRKCAKGAGMSFGASSCAPPNRLRDAAAAFAVVARAHGEVLAKRSREVRRVVEPPAERDLGDATLAPHRIAQLTRALLETPHAYVARDGLIVRREQHLQIA